MIKTIFLDQANLSEIVLWSNQFEGRCEYNIVGVFDGAKIKISRHMQYNTNNEQEIKDFTGLTDILIPILTIDPLSSNPEEALMINNFNGFIRNGALKIELINATALTKIAFTIGNVILI